MSAHTMRHSFATLAIREGASVKSVSEYFGHSSTAITLDMCVHERLEKGQKPIWLRTSPCRMGLHQSKSGCTWSLTAPPLSYSLDR